MLLKMDKAVPIVLLLGVMGLNKVLPNEVVKKNLTAFMYRTGVVMTLGMSKHPSVGPVWNKTVEPLVVDLLDNFAYSVKEGLVKGLRSDDMPSSEPPKPLPAAESPTFDPPAIQPEPTVEPIVRQEKKRAWWRISKD